MVCCAEKNAAKVAVLFLLVLNTELFILRRSIKSINCHDNPAPLNLCLCYLADSRTPDNQEDTCRCSHLECIRRFLHSDKVVLFRRNDLQLEGFKS